MVLDIAVLGGKVTLLDASELRGPVTGLEYIELEYEDSRPSMIKWETRGLEIEGSVIYITELDDIDS